MPRYFFHTLDGKFVRDDLGEVLPNDDAAKTEALSVFGELIQHCGKGFWDTREFSVIATNESRDVVVTITASVTDVWPDDDRIDL